MSSDAYNCQRFGWDFESGADARGLTEAPALGTEMPGFELPGLEGRHHRLRDFGGHPLVIELAETIASKRTLSIEATMVAIGQQWHPGLQEGLALELSQFGRMFSPDHLAPRLEAFLAGSPVDYTSE